MERGRVGAGTRSGFGAFATGRRASGPVRPRSVVSVDWAVHEVALGTLHRLPKSGTIKSTIGWRRIGASSSPNHEAGSTGKRTGRPITPFGVVTVNCGGRTQ